jgi:threonine aldolase
LKLAAVGGAHGKIDSGTLAARLAAGRRGVHHMQPAAISLTQATEAGTVYAPEEIAAIGELARQHGLALHVDGARFANAVARLGKAPAESTWRAGVDALSFGATKNGAAAAEAVIFFEPRRAEEFALRRKRGGHLLAKMRFLSVQLEAYLADELWLRNAHHANAAASRLAAGLVGLPGVRLRHPVEANEIFAELPGGMIEALFTAGFKFYRWEGDCVRLVTAFDTRAADVDSFLAAAAGWSAR